jgi:hypothetical protein
MAKQSSRRGAFGEVCLCMRHGYRAGSDHMQAVKRKQQFATKSVPPPRNVAGGRSVAAETVLRRNSLRRKRGHYKFYILM